MGQFKPMVKMETTEPTVILKLKKGGKVKNKMFAEGGNCGHQPMQAKAHAMHEAMEAEGGNAPKKPSMAERRKAMNPTFKKGGKVVHKALGGALAPAVGQAVGQAVQGLAAPSAASSMREPLSSSMPANPLASSMPAKPLETYVPTVKSMLANTIASSPMPAKPLAPDENSALAAWKQANFGALDQPNSPYITPPNPMTEEEFRARAQLSRNEYLASHPGFVFPVGNLPFEGPDWTGESPAYNPQGKAMRAPMGRSMGDDMRDDMFGRPMGGPMGGPNKHGNGMGRGPMGKLNRGPFGGPMGGPMGGPHKQGNGMARAPSQLDRDEYLASHPSPSLIEQLQPPQPMRNRPEYMYAKGGSIKHKPGSKAAINALKKELMHHEALSMGNAHPQRKANGGTIQGNEGEYRNTKVVTAKHDRASGTGGVRMGNAGGFADGGAIDRKLTRTTVEGGNWENRAADTAKPGKVNTQTSGVKNGNGGGFRNGGKASKKAYATGGNVVNDGKAVKMPRHFVSEPVANSLQSGTFKRGGKVKKFSDGGGQDAQTRREQQGYDAWKESQLRERQEEKDSVNPMTYIQPAIEFISSKLFPTPKLPAQTGTTTVKSVTVTPSKKARGGSAHLAGGGTPDWDNPMSSNDFFHGDEDFIEFERKPSARAKKAFAESQRKQLENNPNYKADKADKAQKAYEKHCELVGKLWK